MRRMWNGLAMTMATGVYQLGWWLVLALALTWIGFILSGWTLQVVYAFGAWSNLVMVVFAGALAVLTVGAIYRRLQSVRTLFAWVRIQVERIPLVGRAATAAQQIVGLIVPDPDKPAPTESRAALFELAPGTSVLAMITREWEVEVDGARRSFLYLSLPCGGSLCALAMVVEAGDPRLCRLDGLGGDAVLTGVLTFGQGFTPNQLNVIARRLVASETTRLTSV